MADKWPSRLTCQRCGLHDKLVLCDGQHWGKNDMGEPEYKYDCSDPKCGWTCVSTVFYR